MFTRTSEYALRAVIWLAGHRGKQQVVEQIAEGTRVPADYLAKVLHKLGRAGIVDAQRGFNGGFALPPSSEKMSLLQVINAVDPIRRIKECPMGLDEHMGQLCALHQRLDAAIAGVERALSASTIADILKDPDSVHRLGDPRPRRSGGADASPCMIRPIGHDPLDCNRTEGK
jgi:Rrf2 family transcriptional regulator, nitric oxide-sensitive transcriptional repressor